MDLILTQPCYDTKGDLFTHEEATALIEARDRLSRLDREIEDLLHPLVLSQIRLALDHERSLLPLIFLSNDLLYDLLNLIDIEHIGLNW